MINIILTSAAEHLLGGLKRKSKDFFDLFDEIYCKEDFDLLEDIPGCSPHLFKNIKKIKADCMIESKNSYQTYSNNLRLGDRYLILQKYRDFLLDEPTKWQIKLLGESVVEQRQQRRKDKECWVFDVLDFVEKLKRQDAKTP